MVFVIVNMMVEEICKRYGILALYAFGSKALEAVKLASGEKIQPEVDSLSDIDIGVVFFQRPRNVSERLRLYKTLYAELSEVFNPYQLDLIFLQEAGIIVRFQAINGLVLFSADEDRRLEYEEMVIKFYQDYKPDYDQYKREVLEEIAR